MQSIILIMLSFLFSLNELVYKESTGDIVTINKCQIIPQGKGYVITFNSYIDNVEQINMEFETDLYYSTLSWKYIDNKNKTRLNANRKDNCIILNGILNNKTVDKKYQIDASPWKQCFPLDLGKSLKINKGTMCFWSISPKNLDISEFTAKIKDTTPLKTNSLLTDSYHVTISIKGFYSLFWSADSWYKRTDLTFLKYSGVNGPPKSPITIIELQK